MSEAQHEYFEQLCSNYVDGTLTDVEREKLEEHLEECPSCAALLRDLQDMQTAFSQPVDMPETLHDEIMKKIRQENPMQVIRPVKPARRFPALTMVAAAAVVVLVALGGGIGQFFNQVSVSGTGDNAVTAADDITAYQKATVRQAPQSDEQDAGSAEEKTAEPEDASGAAGEASTWNAEQGAGGTVSAPVQGQTNVATAPVTKEPGLAQLQPSQQNGTTGGAADGAHADASMITVLPTVTLPEGIRGMTVSHCYIAEGSGEIPDLDGTLIFGKDGVSYFTFANSMTTIETTFASMEEAGYTVTAYSDVSLVMDSKAEQWLLIVVKN